jgi:anti-sigma factor RsiW
MKCEEMDELLEAYADGEASAQETVAVSAHLEGCPRCERSLRWISATKAVARGVRAPAMPPELKRELLAAAAMRERQPAASNWLSKLGDFWTARPWAAGGAAAFAAAAVVVAVRVAPQPAEELPLEAILAAHKEYARLMPLSSDEQLFSELAADQEPEAGHGL